LLYENTTPHAAKQSKLVLQSALRLCGSARCRKLQLVRAERREHAALACSAACSGAALWKLRRVSALVAGVCTYVISEQMVILVTDVCGRCSWHQLFYGKPLDEISMETNCS
jgi:hypothetical protein